MSILTTLPAPPEPEVNLARRRLLAAGAATAVGFMCPTFAAAPAATDSAGVMAQLPIDPDFWARPRELWLWLRATGESQRLVYWQDGQRNDAAYYVLCQLLRDWHVQQAVQMDMNLLDTLFAVSAYYRAYGWNQPIVINSGFRSFQTNQKLLNEGAAKNSMHLYGKAADIYIPGISAKHLTQVGLYLRRGGIGFYEQKGFVHLDTGRLRAWRG